MSSSSTSTSAAAAPVDTKATTAEPNEKEKEKTKEKSEKGGEHINLKVKTQDGQEIYFKVRKTTVFKKVFVAFARKVGADLAGVRFLFDGNRIQETDTPEKLDMTNEDEIDAMVSQTGGCGDETEWEAIGDKFDKVMIWCFKLYILYLFLCWAYESLQKANLVVDRLEAYHSSLEHA